MPKLPWWFSNTGLTRCLWLVAGAAIGVGVCFAYFVYSAIEHVR